jgi:hypothetical protein
LVDEGEIAVAGMASIVQQAKNTILAKYPIEKRGAQFRKLEFF